MIDFVYRCTRCDRVYPRDEVRYLCPACEVNTPEGGPLEGVLVVDLDYERIADELDTARPDWSLWCPVAREHLPDYAVGNTPLVSVPRLGAELGFSDLAVKNDGLNPSGSLKDRASYLVVGEASRLGEERVVCASTGNAAAALAAVCAAAGQEAIVFVPEDAPKAKLVSMLLHGARVIRVRGDYDDAYRLSLAYTRERGGLNRNTAYHPLTIEGKKTVSFEIFAQSGGVPDAVVVPVGDGVILAGVHKGFVDLRRAGVIARLPRLIAVQAESSDAIHHLVTTGRYRAAAPSTVADSLSVTAPANAWLAARAVEESGGASLVVSDEEILAGQRLLAETTGIFAEPAAAAVVAGARKACREALDPAEKTVLLVTGHGLKDVDAPLSRLVLPEPVPPDLAAIEL